MKIALSVVRNTPLGDSRYRKRALKVLKRLHPGAVDTYLWGAPVRLHPWKNVCERNALLWPEQMDPAEHELVAKIMASRPSVFVDVGANAGLYSLHAALSSVAGGRILAVEPNAALIDRLLFNLALARQRGHVSSDVNLTTVPAALSDYEGPGHLSAELREGYRHLAADGEVVPVRLFHRILVENGVDRIDLMKIDVEGHEDRVLSPFFRTAPPELWPTTIIIEHALRRRWLTDCLAECEALGYSKLSQSGGNSILTRLT